jgi:hypothetical protein
MATNPQSQCWPGAHDEVEQGCTGFTGARPGARALAAGYSYAVVTEVIDWKPTVEEAVDAWVWTVYHRRSFLEWNLLHAGYGRAYGPYRNTQKWHNVMDFALPRSGGATRPPEPVVFPVPGQSEVPISFEGNLEEPVPPAPPGGRWPSGTVVSVHFPSSSWSIAGHRLFRAGAGTCTEVAHTFITRANDPNLESRESDEAFLYANQPLEASAEYVAQVEGTFNGVPFSRTWAFATR